MNTLRQDLIDLAKQLRTFHLALLDQVKYAYQAKTGTKPSPFELFNLVLNHEDFQWLRPLSRLMATLDEMIDSKGPLTTNDLRQIESSLYGFFSPLEPAYTDFRREHARMKSEARVSETELAWRTRLAELRKTYLEDGLN